MQHLQNPFYNESDISAADQIEQVGPIANIFFPDDNNETFHKHSLTESDKRSVTSSSCYDVQKYDYISEEIWSPEQLKFICLKCFLEFPTILTYYCLLCSSCFPIILVLCCNIKNIALTFLFECSIRVIMIQRIGVFDPTHTFLCIVNVLVEHRIELFNIVQCILYVKNREYRPNFSPLC